MLSARPAPPPLPSWGQAQPQPPQGINSRSAPQRVSLSSQDSSLSPYPRPLRLNIS
jgi:hypothetical protein